MADELLGPGMLAALVGAGALGAVLGAAGTWGMLTGLGRQSPSRLRERLRVAERERDDLQARRGELPEEARGAFDAWLAYESQTRDALQRWEQQCDDLRRAAADAKGSALVERRYPVFLDGLSESGKTTFAWRLLKPTLSPEKLQVFSATPGAMRTPPLPIAMEEPRGEARVLHELYFYDTAGEKGATLVNCLQRYAQDRGQSTQKGVILFVWDCSKPVETNRSFLQGRVNNIYGADLARETVASIVVLFNKVDVIAPDLAGQKREEEVARQLAQLREEINANLMSKIVGDLDHPVEYTAGSMLSGAGIHLCYGLILSRFNLPSLFERPFEPLDSHGKSTPLARVDTKVYDRTRARP